jgi:hypothetical protein
MSDTLTRILHRLPSNNGKVRHEHRVLTIRVSNELHTALQQEAKERETSVNKLAVAKLSLKATVLDHVVQAMADMEAEDVVV